MSTYPVSNIITLNQNNTRYTYTIIKEGYYPQNEEVPVFKILFGENFQLYVKSTQSATSAANAYLQMKKPNTQARLSGIHIFFLNSQELEREHERKHRSHLLKPFNKLKICFAVQDKNFQANFGVQNKEKENQRNEAFVKVIDQVVEEVLKYIDNPIINLRISGDDRNMENENYILLQKMITPIAHELNNLVLNGLKDLNGIFVHDAFVQKKILETGKNKTITGHTKPPLLQIIPLDHYISDKLHIMLRIWNRLWDLAIQELKMKNQFNELIRTKIIVEINRIKISFIVFNEERAFLINCLWRNFYQLYISMKSNETNPSQFANQAKKWLDLFLTPSQGEPNTINFKMGLYHPKDSSGEEKS
ncbi:hypothetical protein C1645_814133 [Glomus cerebriforme]|uniref:Uncharacterized protein n=1 Tax=Glomus cerebriforme TaxID=658196 RepID=A0A397TLT3_9GLOM|nr:hypothetical protein C1645_814133 [Glomus cerebriforme]